MKWFVRLLKVAYIALIAALPVAAMADYLATAGSGLTFGSIDLAGIKFPAFIGCDPTTAKQCWSISAAGAVKVDGSAVTQPVSLTSTTVTGNVTAVQPTGTNLHAVLDTTSTTAVTQATGTNLHAVLDTTSTTAVTQATAANLNATVVQGTGTNLHTVVDSATGLAQGSTTSGQTGSLIMGAVTTAAPTNTTGQTAYASLATTGGLRVAGDGTKLLVTPDSVALPANQSVNVAQFGGTSTATGQVAVSVAPVTATNTALVVDLRPDSPGIIALGGATPANSVPTVSAGFTAGNMTTATTTTFKSGAGVLHTITINSLGTVASTISVFDNTAGSGTSLGVLNSLTTGQATYTYDVAFATGLTLVTTGTVAPNVTVSYR